MRFRMYSLFVYFLVFFIFMPSNALAYLDPGTGNTLIYLIFSIFGTLVYWLRGFFYKIKNILGPNNQFEVEKDYNKLIIFSEGKNYWYTFKPIIEALIELKIAFEYVSMDIEDPALTIQHDLMKARYIGTGAKAFAKVAQKKNKVMLSTTPNIGCPNFPMSKPIGIRHLVHVFHAIADVGFYHKGALDFYDSIIMVGNFGIKPTQQLEKLRNTEPKECVVLGLPYLDELVKQVSTEKYNTTNKVILIAPSWGEKSCLSICGHEFILQLARQNFDIILRPHPHSFIVEEEMLNEITKIVESYPNIKIDRNIDGSVSMNRADLMISDYSGARYDFAFLYEKPVISLKIPSDLLQNFELTDVGYSWGIDSSSEIGLLLEKTDFDNIAEHVNKALKIPARDLVNFRNESVINFGKCGKSIAKWLVDKTEEETNINRVK